MMLALFQFRFILLGLVRFGSLPLLLAGLLTGTNPPAITTLQAQASQPLVIVVRDGAGNPLQGIALGILLAGPPHEAYDNCVTDQAGQCTLIIPPGAYIVHFQRGWRGREFIPTTEQNASAQNDGGSGGFGIYLEPDSADQVVTFVIGQDRETGQLIPLWDISRDPTVPPQPFAYDGNPLANPDETLEGISLEALDTAISGSLPQADIDATATAQVLVSQIDPGQPVEAEVPDTATVLPEPEATPEPEYDSLPGNVLGLALIGLLAAVLIAGGVALLIKRRKAKRA